MYIYIHFSILLISTKKQINVAIKRSIFFSKRSIRCCAMCLSKWSELIFFSIKKSPDNLHFCIHLTGNNSTQNRCVYASMAQRAINCCYNVQRWASKIKSIKQILLKVRKDTLRVRKISANQSKADSVLMKRINRQDLPFNCAEKKIAKTNAK